MHRLLVLALLFANFAASFGRAGETEDFAAVRRADQHRIVATIAADTSALTRLLSDELVYAHGDGRVQTKPQLLSAVAAQRVKYVAVVPEEVGFQTVAPGLVVTMHGRARLTVEAEGRQQEFTLRFLSVWRREGDAWRLLSYQSSPLTAGTVSLAR